jgi:hypothetical protein
MICGCTPSDYLSSTRLLRLLSLSLGLRAVDHEGADGFDLGKSSSNPTMPPPDMMPSAAIWLHAVIA